MTDEPMYPPTPSKRIWYKGEMLPWDQYVEIKKAEGRPLYSPPPPEAAKTEPDTPSTMVAQEPPAPQPPIETIREIERENLTLSVKLSPDVSKVAEMPAGGFQTRCGEPVKDAPCLFCTSHGWKGRVFVLKGSGDRELFCLECLHTWDKDNPGGHYSLLNGAKNQDPVIAPEKCSGAENAPNGADTRMPDAARPAPKPTDAMREYVALLKKPGETIEIRCIEKGGAIHSGYYRDIDRLLHDLEATDARGDIGGCYLVINEIDPALYARRADRMAKLGPKESTTADEVVVRRRWIPFDIDPKVAGKKIAGISATDEEHDRAIAKAWEIREWLMADLGFPDMIVTDSGNGAYVVLPIDLENTPETLELVDRCFSTLEAFKGDDYTEIDRTSKNAARISKLVGTVARKGDNTAERPHRRSRLLHKPTTIEPVPREKLERLANMIPKPEPAPQRPIHQGGGKIDLEEKLAAWGIGWKEKKNTTAGMLYVLDECPFSTAHKTGAYAIQMNSGAVKVACQHDTCGATDNRWAELRERYEGKRPEKPKPQKDEEKTLVAKLPQGFISAPIEIKEPQDGPQSKHYTDLGNGSRFVSYYRDAARYCTAMDKWFLWDETRWRQDDTGRIFLMGKDVVRFMYALVSEIKDDDDRKDAAKLVIKCESTGRIKSMIEQSAPELAIRPDDLDAQPLLFNVENGTINLAAPVTFREHRREDMISQMANVEYDAGAACPTWVHHIDTIFQNEAGIIAAFKRLCGYALLGDNPAELMIFLYGPGGANGKSKTMEVLAAIWGDYAKNADPETFMVKRGGTVRTDVARLAKARLVTSSEGDKRGKLAESLVKRWAGRDMITARFLFQEEFEFRATSKVWLATNHLPKVENQDEGIWRKIAVVPFEYSIPEADRDPAIAEKLLAERAGILNWCIDGLRDYYTLGGLAIPAKMQTAKKTYKESQDTLKRFLEDETEEKKDARASRDDLYHTYEEYMGDDKGLSRRDFFAAIRALGYDDTKSNGVRYVSGIRLLRQLDIESASEGHKGT